MQKQVETKRKRPSSKWPSEIKSGPWLHKPFARSNWSLSKQETLFFLFSLFPFPILGQKSILGHLGKKTPRGATARPPPSSRGPRTRADPFLVSSSFFCSNFPFALAGSLRNFVDNLNPICITHLPSIFLLSLNLQRRISGIGANNKHLTMPRRLPPFGKVGGLSTPPTNLPEVTQKDLLGAASPYWDSRAPITCLDVDV